MFRIDCPSLRHHRHNNRQRSVGRDQEFCRASPFAACQSRSPRFPSWGWGGGTLVTFLNTNFSGAWNFQQRKGLDGDPRKSIVVFGSSRGKNKLPRFSAQAWCEPSARNTRPGLPPPALLPRPPPRVLCVVVMSRIGDFAYCSRRIPHYQCLGRAHKRRIAKIPTGPPPARAQNHFQNIGCARCQKGPHQDRRGPATGNNEYRRRVHKSTQSSPAPQSMPAHHRTSYRPWPTPLNFVAHH